MYKFGLVINFNQISRDNYKIFKSVQINIPI